MRRVLLVLALFASLTCVLATKPLATASVKKLAASSSSNVKPDMARVAEAFARASLDKAHPGGKGAASATTVAEMSKRVLDHLARQPQDVQKRRVDTMNSHLSLP